jgi:hypothetical protein
MQAITDRVLGLTMPRVPMGARLPRPWDRRMGMILLIISALVTVACLILWAFGDTTAALRLFGGTVLALAIALRLL